MGGTSLLWNREGISPLHRQGEGRGTEMGGGVGLKVRRLPVNTTSPNKTFSEMPHSDGMFQSVTAWGPGVKTGFNQISKGVHEITK